MSDKRFTFAIAYDTPFFYDDGNPLEPKEVVGLLNEQQEQLDLYKEAMVKMQN